MFCLCWRTFFIGLIASNVAISFIHSACRWSFSLSDAASTNPKVKRFEIFNKKSLVLTNYLWQSKYDKRYGSVELLPYDGKNDFPTLSEPKWFGLKVNIGSEISLRRDLMKMMKDNHVWKEQISNTYVLTNAQKEYVGKHLTLKYSVTVPGSLLIKTKINENVIKMLLDLEDVFGFEKDRYDKICPFNHFMDAMIEESVAYEQQLEQELKEDIASSFQKGDVVKVISGPYSGNRGLIDGTRLNCFKVIIDFGHTKQLQFFQPGELIKVDVNYSKDVSLFERNEELTPEMQIKRDIDHLSRQQKESITRCLNRTEQYLDSHRHDPDIPTRNRRYLERQIRQQQQLSIINNDFG